MSDDNFDEDAERDRTNRLVFLVAVVIVAVGLGLLWLMKHYQNAENCRLEGRRDCDPISVPNS